MSACAATLGATKGSRAAPKEGTLPSEREQELAEAQHLFESLSAIPAAHYYGCNTILKCEEIYTETRRYPADGSPMLTAYQETQAKLSMESLVWFLAHYIVCRKSEDLAAKADEDALRISSSFYWFYSAIDKNLLLAPAHRSTAWLTTERVKEFMKMYRKPTQD